MERQDNSYDCGPSVCLMADALAAGVPLTVITCDVVAKIRIHMANCLRVGEALDLANLVTSEIRPRRSRQVPVDSAPTEAANGVDGRSEHPQVKPRTSLPDFQFDIQAITEVESHQLKQPLDPLRATPGDVQEGTCQQDELLKRDCQTLEADYSHTGMSDGIPPMHRRGCRQYHRREGSQCSTPDIATTLI